MTFSRCSRSRIFLLFFPNIYQTSWVINRFVNEQKMGRATYLFLVTLSNIHLVINHYCSRLIYLLFITSDLLLFHQYYLYFICSKFSKKKKKKDKFVAIPFVFFLYHYPCLIPDSLRLSKMAHVNIDFYLIYVNNSEVKPLQL